MRENFWESGINLIVARKFWESRIDTIVARKILGEWNPLNSCANSNCRLGIDLIVAQANLAEIRLLKGELSSFPKVRAEILNPMLKRLFQYEFLRNVIVDAFKHTSITFFDQNAWKRVCVIRNILQIRPKCQPKDNNFRKLTGNVD